jgi:hypothetical protein
MQRKIERLEAGEDQGSGARPTAHRRRGSFEQTPETQSFVAGLVADTGIIEIERGDTHYLEGTVTEDDGSTAFDLTGCNMWHTAKANIEDTDLEAIFQKTEVDGITITDAFNGGYRIKLDPADTSGLLVDTTLVFDVQLKTPSGDVRTVTEGVYAVSQDITQSIV